MAKLFRPALLPLMLCVWANTGMVAASDVVSAPQEALSDVAPQTAKTELDELAPPPPSTRSLVRYLKQLVAAQLIATETQWVNALVAFLFGVVMVLDGESVFKWVVVAAAVVFACVVTMSDLRAPWAMKDNFLFSHIVGIEVGLVAGYAAWLGYEGVVVLVGALAGGAVARYLQILMIWHGSAAFATNGKLIIIFYAVFALAGIVLFRRKKHAKLLAIASSLVGGGLAASACAWGLTFWALQSKLFKALTPQGGVWIEFFDLIWKPGSKDVGLLAGSNYNFLLRGEVWRSDRMGSVLLALGFFAIGVVVQFKSLNKRAKAGGAKAREISPLNEALLSHA